MINMEKQTINDNSRKNDDSLHIASKCWKRVMDIAAKTGYREGIQDGADSVLQNGFDMGYKDGFEIAFMLGRYKGLLAAMSPSLKHSADVTVVLDKTRRGACWICNVESQNEIEPSYEQIPFSEILNNQKTYSVEVIKRLREYTESLLEKKSI